MEKAISITLNTPYLVEQVYRRIVGELRARGYVVAPRVEGNKIVIPYTEETRSAVWHVVKSLPPAVFTSIDLK
ncbi:hypothetical protein [Pyrobaculum neutrophilum]|uniref:Uncharacterized protein n=1 Tax=Pyrobaculum neutrophilum (strain DSM 2338 / JCM 9278 / NBRC 100436 / V24Sta) TaxID=444157 RepID=B1Y8S6_PYRNV|nr:hypothetical protein [Pyrobaculum neutrophilum]ACB40155.1 conserved hypothetical protein [Pyrobaculum neutrophilum V24Sta]